MSNLFADPKITNPGMMISGWRGFGGLAIAAGGDVVPHFNLAASWNRSFVVNYGFIEGLIPPRLPDKMWFRPPGHFRADQNLDNLRQHNLMACRKDNDSLVIWTVNERSDKKIVEEFIAKESCDSEDWYLSRDVLASRTTTFSDPIQELRTSNWLSMSFWCRLRRKLCITKEDFEDNTAVFQNSVKAFEENKYMEGEVVLIDSAGMIWSGDLEQGLGRTKNKCGDSLNLISISEHPRVIYGAADFHVRTVDLRADTIDTMTLLFNVPRISHSLFDKDKYIQSPIMHLKSLPNKEHYVLAVTERHTYIFDNRVPGKDVLTQDHNIPEGGHVVVCSNSVDDPSSEGLIHNHFILDHGFSGVWISKLYEHKSEFFSSISPIHQLTSPEDAFHVLGPPLSDCTYQARDPPRAIALVQGYRDRKNTQVDVLLRALDDGAIVYNKLHYGEASEPSTSEAGHRSRKRFLEWAEECGDEKENWGRYHQSINKEDFCETVSVHFEVPELDTDFDPSSSHPLDFKPNHMNCSFPPLQPPHPEAIISNRSEICGFRGSLGCSNEKGEAVPDGYDAANLAQTYSALLSLAIVGDDFKNVDRAAILATIRKSQKEDGSFWSQGPGSESDMRFVFCAVAICHILGDDSAIDWGKLGNFITSSFNYDGGLGQLPGNESHGGSTYCAIASLALANKLWDQSVLTNKQIQRLIKWALWKQEEGFHGRAHKPDDTCYAFWIGATLEILNVHPLANQEKLRNFLLISQNTFFGGFCKVPEVGTASDILHTYFSIAALSLLREPGFGPVCAPLNVSRRAYENILNSQKNLK